MIGKDCERILSSLNQMIDAASDAIETIAKLNAPPIKVKADHTHMDEGKGDASKTEFIEKESVVSVAGPLSKVNSILEGLSEDIGKLDSLEEGLYTDIKSFNNSIGSPWTEIKRLKKVINKLSSYTGTDYVGDRAVIIAMLSSVQASAVDAKWAMIIYHDYIQRGFDNIFNDNNPSIVFKKNYKIDELDVRLTTGQKNQEIENNVHIKKGNYDPF